MAKQTFTTGSVLTAAQMNNLQANDYNWTVNQKTASYVLAASDVGTRIEMNSGSATTVTVNTGIFAAGDTLFIQNIGTGSCVVTAGTATVQRASNASLTLAQYQGGYLYFISTGNAVFFADAGYTPPLTTKGDLFGYSTTSARIPIGSDNQVLTADSTQALGLKWATPATTKSFSLLNAGGTSLTGAATITVSHGSGYDQLYVLVVNASSASASSFIDLRFNSDSGANYNWYGATWAGDASYSAGYMGGTGNTNSAQFRIGIMSGSASSTVNGGAYLFGANTSGVKMAQILGAGGPSSSNGQAAYNAIGYYNSSSVISSTSLISTVGNFDGGTLFIYGAA